MVCMDTAYLRHTHSYILWYTSTICVWTDPHYTSSPGRKLFSPENAHNMNLSNTPWNFCVFHIWWNLEKTALEHFYLFFSCPVPWTRLCPEVPSGHSARWDGSGIYSTLHDLSRCNNLSILHLAFTYACANRSVHHSMNITVAAPAGVDQSCSSRCRIFLL